MNFRKNMASLLTLSDDYYHNRISFSEYREKRKEFIDLIDKDLNGVVVPANNKQGDKLNDESLMNKALSFLKLDKVKETN
ncbi:MAG: hypothetical protein OQK75_11355 [Gammaproteobacteria bacterium]|nr:hypothetical protein [Gammaproteobacteria bacterium]MCW8988250.1 hypothetical protein [Gammaproteobacteria bacterium]MCW9032208.1 hypothetical protein [Gammaproteobacteria bacterium]